jgi:hypothetical protein
MAWRGGAAHCCKVIWVDVDVSDVASVDSRQAPEIE